MEYRAIKPEHLKVLKTAAWSVENMEAHGAGGRSTEYIGSSAEKDIIHDYYRDTEGAFWYKTRRVVRGETVSMERYIFGREVRAHRKANKK